MRRLLRRAFHLSAVVSAVMFLGVCAFWVRSRWWSDRLDWDCGGLRSWVVGTRAGACYVEWNRANWGSPHQATWSYSSSDLTTAPRAIDVDEGPPVWSCLGLACGRTDYGTLVMGGLPPMTMRGWYVVAPFWLVAAATAASPLLALLRWRMGRRGGPGHCRSCGYDLRATPDRCPECGTEGGNNAVLS